MTVMRVSIFRTLIYSGLVLLALGLFKTQVLEGRHYRELGEKNRIRLIPLEASRGRVFDRHKNLLATNRSSYDVVATPEDVTPEVFPTLAKLLNLSEKEIHRRMKAPREYPFAPALIMPDVTRELAFRVEELRPELPGVSLRISGIRYYPFGETASHLIGYIGKISPEEYREKPRDKYGLTSYVGRAGIEKIFDERLRGWRGGRQIEVDARGRLLQILSERAPEPGEDLVVTLDLEFQQKVMALIEGKKASVAVLDLKNGELIALASSPAYDPNVFVSPQYSQERMKVLKDPQAPMLDRGVSSVYPPGSIFKLVTALAGLEKGKITPTTRFNCTGQFRLKPGSRPYRCWNASGHGHVNLYDAIERSCNVYFYNIASRLSADDIAYYARELGLGERMELEATHIAPGLVPDSVWKKEKYHEKWYQGETLSFAIGQSYLLVSPLQILKLVATIAKGGETVEPHLIVENHPAHHATKPAIHKENIEIIKKAMLKVVESDYGTGQLARVDFDRMAAKTGTAQAPPNEPHSWMTGFFPYKEPQIAFVVFVEHGGSGGITSAAIVKETIQIWKDRNQNV